MTNDICRETIFTEYFNSRKEIHQKSTTQPIYANAHLMQILFNEYKAHVIKFINDYKQKGDEYHQETLVIANDIIRRELVDACISHRHYEDKNIIITSGNFVTCIKENYLLDTVKELKGEIDALKAVMSRNDNTVKELKSEIDTLKAVISGNGDVMDAVMVIQRYWRRYLLVKNVKKFARQYESMLIEDYRKTLTSGIGTSRDALLKAAESRVKQPVKVSRSTSSSWSYTKAASIASDWNS